MNHLQLTRVFREQIRQARREFLESLDWIEAELDRLETTAQAVEDETEESESSEMEAPESEDELLNDRHHWVLDQLRDGVQLTRAMVMERFQLGDRQAKRELSFLRRRGMIDFVRAPRPGHYVLRMQIRKCSRRHAEEEPQEPACPIPAVPHAVSTQCQGE